MNPELEPMEPADRESLVHAVYVLEANSFMTMLARLIGQPADALIAALPPFVGATISSASQNAILQCLKFAMRPRSPRSLLGIAGNHPALVSGLAGAVSGFVGMAALAVELPLTTIVMFQSIVGIAAEAGEDISRPEVRVACLEVFGLSSDGKGPAATESGYYAARHALAKPAREAADYVLRRGTSLKTAPVVVEFVSAIAPRFGLLVSQELAATAVPIIGAATGSSLNIAFVQHFNNVARGHFAVRALERKYGEERVRQEFELIRATARRTRRPKRLKKTTEDISA